MQGSQETKAYTVQKLTHKPNGRKDLRKGKNDRYCEHCKIKGHQADQCFKLYGYPDWYKDKFGSKLKTAAHVGAQETPLDHLISSSEELSVDIALVNAVY